jgi:hypothetical protein
MYGVRWAGNNRYDRNVEEVIPALNHNTAGTIIIDEDSVCPGGRRGK